MIRMTIHSLPPSVNDLYMPVTKGGGPHKVTIQVLKPEGRKYKTETISYLVKTYQSQLTQFTSKGTYVLYAAFGFTNLENSTWPSRAEHRYKKIDGSNRVKVLEDVIAEASAVDDSTYIMSCCRKYQSDSPRTDVWLWDIEQEACPFYATALVI